MRKLVIAFLSFAVLSCNNAERKAYNDSLPKEPAVVDPSEYDSKRGEGDFKEVVLAPIDAKKAKAGKAIYEVKCHSCHNLTDQKLVGPGWLGVTQRHRPEWILNFITNPDAMIDKDPKLLAQLEMCLIRMPDQGLTEDDAYNILDFMRKNDEKYNK